MPGGTSMSLMQQALPGRTFDVGISEGHAVTFAGGLAKEGLKPFVAIYSSFLQRAYDEIIHDVAIAQLPVTFCIDRGGLVGEDGVTHHGLFDLAYLRCIPGMVVAAPSNEHDLRNLMYTSQLPDCRVPFAIRYPRGRGVLKNWQNPMQELPIGRGRKLCDGRRVAILSLGHITNIAAQAVEQLRDQGIEVAHYDMIFLKPLDDGIMSHVAGAFQHVVTVEDGTTVGGLGSAVLEYMADHGMHPTVTRLGLPDEFVEHGSPAELYHIVGLDAEGIRRAILSPTEH